MSKRDDLKRKLKAAGQRRARRQEARPVVSQDAPGSVACHSSSASNQVDVAGCLVSEIVAVGRKVDLVDADVISALRVCLTPTAACAGAAIPLRDRFEKIRQQDDVSSHRFRKAAESVLSTAIEHRTADQKTAFMQYLSLFAS